MRLLIQQESIENGKNMVNPLTNRNLFSPSIVFFILKISRRKNENENHRKCEINVKKCVENIDFYITESLRLFLVHFMMINMEWQIIETICIVYVCTVRCVCVCDCVQSDELSAGREGSM